MITVITIDVVVITAVFLLAGLISFYRIDYIDIYVYVHVCVFVFV